MQALTALVLAVMMLVASNYNLSNLNLEHYKQKDLITKDTITCEVGDSSMLLDNSDVDGYLSSDESVVQIVTQGSSTLVLKAVGVGKAEITVLDNDYAGGGNYIGFYDTVTVEVTERTTLIDQTYIDNYLKLDFYKKESISCKIGEYRELDDDMTAYFHDVEGMASSDESVVQVKKYGYSTYILKAVGPGTANIVIYDDCYDYYSKYSYEGHYDIVTVTVSGMQSDFEKKYQEEYLRIDAIDDDLITCTYGEQKYLCDDDVRLDGNYYYFDFCVSSDESIVKVEEISGKYHITAVGVGTAEIVIYEDESIYNTDFKGYYDTVIVEVKPISSDQVTCEKISSKKYTGKAIRPAVVLTYGDKTLVKGEDYTVTYADNIDVGKAKVTVKLKGAYEGTIKKSFYIIPLIDKTKLSLYDGQSGQIEVISTSEVTYSSSDTSIAKVSKSGKITGVSAGKATITATSNGATCKCVVTVKARIKSDQVTCEKISSKKYTGKAIKPAVELTYGDKTLVKGEDYTVTYADNIDVGKATVTVKLKGAYKGTIKKSFYIIPLIDKTKLSIYDGQSGQIEVTSSSKVTYSSSDTSIAKVSKSGKITGVSAGKATITATSNGATCKCVVTVKARKLNAGKKTLYNGDSYTLKYTGGSGDITWKSSDTKIATVSAKGKVTAKSAGKATITATRNGKKISCVITVKNLKLSATKFTIYTGDSKTLTLTGAFDTVTWSSSNKSVATVNASGKVTAKKAGTVTVTATHNKISYKCTVTVKKKPAITINEVNWYMNTVDGVEPWVEFTNNSSKTIKYVSFDVKFYNRVGDPLKNFGWSIGDTYKTLRITGPIEKGETHTAYWDAVFYHSSVTALRVYNVKITYMDGTTETVKYDSTWS